jgi:hypothetical protein
MEAFTQAQCEGYIPEELKRLNNEAHIAKVGAITWLMDVNKRIHEAGL